MAPARALLRRMIRALLLCLLLVACGRPLTQNERAFLSTIHGGTLNMDAVRLHDGAPTRSVTFRRKARPRTTCRELILPPAEEAIVTTKPAAVALFNTILFDEDWYLDDYLPDYPDKLGLVAAMLLSHELTHVWQWQNRKTTGYNPLRAALEHGGGSDPYLFDIETLPRFGGSSAMSGGVVYAGGGTALQKAAGFDHLRTPPFGLPHRNQAEPTPILQARRHWPPEALQECAPCPAS